MSPGRMPNPLRVSALCLSFVLAVDLLPMPMLYCQVPLKREAAVHIEETVGLPRVAWPVGFGVPFRKGELTALSSVSFRPPGGTPFPLQGNIISRWPDGSIKWAYLVSLIDMGPQTISHWQLKWGARADSVRTSTLRVVRGDSDVTVNTGAMEVRMRERGFRLFESVTIDGEQIAKASDDDGAEIVNERGEVFASRNDRDSRLTIEESGPVRSIVRVDGKHTSNSGDHLFDYSARVTFYAGKSWCEVHYTFTNRESSQTSNISAIRLRTSLANPTGAFTGTTSEHKIDKFWEFKALFRIFAGKNNQTGVFGGAVMFRDDNSEIVGKGYESEARARWWVDASDERKGLTVSFKDMETNYPKAIAAGPAGIVAEVYPVTEERPLEFHQGWSKTSTMLFYFHKLDARTSGSRELCFQWQAPVIPWTEYYLGSGVVDDILPYSPAKYPGLERALREGFLKYQAGVGDGMIDVGDSRGSGAGERGDFMANNAYDTPLACFQMWLRSGEPHYWWAGCTTALHTSDIDIVHSSSSSEIEAGGVRIHGRNHVQYNAEGLDGTSVVPSHEWVDGLILAYHLTGELRYRDLAVGVADHLLRALDAGWVLPPFPARWHGARDLGWPLDALTAAYEETNEQKYLLGARKIVAGMKEIQDSTGSFPIYIGPYKAGAPLHQAVVMEGAGRFSSRTGDRDARLVCLKAFDAIKNTMTYPDGELMYITHPAYRTPYRQMPWGGFAWAYAMTGERRYLDLALPLVLRLLRSGEFGVYGEGAFSYPMHGLLRFLKCADNAGLLKDLPGQ